MKKGGRIYSGRGNHHKIISQHNKVSVTGEEIPDANREYGLMKAVHSTTPYPQKDKPVDMAALAARLEAERAHVKVSINSSMGKSERCDGSQTERLKIFNDRRKLFDQGEFTICKGRKLGDDFHPLNFDEQDLHFKALYAKIMGRKSMDTQNFDELAKYCRDNNLKILTGLAPQ